MKQTHTMYLVWINIKKQHDNHLTNDELQTIDDVYLDDRKQSKFNTGIYRFINVVFGLMGLILYWILPNEFAERLFFWLTILFLVYNMFYGIKNWKDYKKIKRVYDDDVQ